MRGRLEIQPPHLVAYSAPPPVADTPPYGRPLPDEAPRRECQVTRTRAEPPTRLRGRTSTGAVQHVFGYDEQDALIAVTRGRAPQEVRLRRRQSITTTTGPLRARLHTAGRRRCLAARSRTGTTSPGDLTPDSDGVHATALTRAPDRHFPVGAHGRFWCANGRRSTVSCRAENRRITVSRSDVVEAAGPVGAGRSLSRTYRPGECPRASAMLMRASSGPKGLPLRGPLLLPRRRYTCEVALWSALIVPGERGPMPLDVRPHDADVELISRL
jgi:hypothetical protein